MEWEVTFRAKPDTTVKVEAVDRWEACVRAVEKLGLNVGNYSMTSLAADASVRKVERKRRLSWWERELEAEKEAKKE